MVKIVERSVVSNQPLHKHQFYCDGCGVFIGSSFPDKNGDIEQVGVYVRKITPHTFTMNLCDKCKLKLNNMSDGEFLSQIKARRGLA